MPEGAARASFATLERLLGRATVVAIAVVFVAGCALRLIWLDSDSWFPNPSWANPLSLNFEEKASAIPARNWVLFGDLDSYGGLYQPQQMMPLGFLLHAAWYRVFGVTLVQTRLPFVLLNLAAWTGLLLLARRQCGPATLLLLTVVTGFNLTLLAYQRSSLDESLLLGTLVLAAAWAPEAGDGPRAHFLWGLLAVLPLTVKATGAVFAAGFALAQAARLWSARRELRGGRPERASPCLIRLFGLTSGLLLAAVASVGLYAAFGLFHPSPFKDWLARFNASMGHVPPWSGAGAYLAAFEAHLPIPEGATAPVLLLALAAPLAVRRRTPLTGFAWTTLLCALVGGAPVYFYYKRIVPLVPIVFYLAAAALQGLLDRLETTSPSPARAVDSRARGLRVRRLVAQAALGLGLVAGLWGMLQSARAGAEETAHFFLGRGPVRVYHDEAIAMRGALPEESVLAAPDTFRLVAFDTPFRYRFTHDMVARHVEGLSEAEAAHRDACVGGVRYLVEASPAVDEPGRTVFDIRRFGLDRAAAECGRQRS
jgi:hypothetical protein